MQAPAMIWSRHFSRDFPAGQKRIMAPWRDAPNRHETRCRPSEPLKSKEEDLMSPMSRRLCVRGATLAPLALSALPVRGQPPAAPGDGFEMVVAGAGHNSLVCAAYLAKAGNRVLVLEGRPTIGGGCKTQEVCLPGFKEDLCSSVHGNIRTSPVYRELRLQEYGLEYLEPDPVMHIPFADGASLTVWRDVDRTCESIAKISKRDADTFRRLVPEFRNSELNSGGEGGRRSAPAGVIQRLSAMS